MEQHYQLGDLEFELEFRYCTLEPSLFTHEAHLRLAWIHISKYGVEKAIKNVCDQILIFDHIHGKGDKFHLTVTIAAVQAVHHFMQKADIRDFASFIAAYPALKYNFKELLESHYSFDIFCSEAARKNFIDPDLEPFQ